MRSLFVFFLVFVSLSIMLAQDGEWEFKKEEEGIKAYTRSKEGIKFNEYLVTTTIKSSLSQVLALMKDFSVHADIFPNTEDHKVYLDEPGQYITYTRLDIPFPARDRDIVFDNRLSYDPDQKILKISVTCIPERYETDKSLIRITYCEGAWEFKDIGNGLLEVRNNMIVDPGGMAPAFIVNAKTIDDPIKTLISMKAHIDNERYKGHKFDLLNPQ